MLKIRTVIQTGQIQFFFLTALQSKYFHLCCVLQVSAYTAPKRQEFLTEKAPKLKDFEFTFTHEITWEFKFLDPRLELKARQQLEKLHNDSLTRPNHNKPHRRMSTLCSVSNPPSAFFLFVNCVSKCLPGGLPSFTLKMVEGQSKQTAWGFRSQIHHYQIEASGSQPGIQSWTLTCCV